MTLHPNVSLPELTFYVQLCKEHKVKKVRVNKLTLLRIRQIGCVVDNDTKLLGIVFFARNSASNPF